MCDDRERLIGYLYDECDAAERRAIDAHLAGCAECRVEIRGLRQTRQDLLAWNVPEPGPIWRPMVQARAAWQAVPAWTLAAAASVMLAVGAVGGAATHALFRSAEGASAVSAPQASPQVIRAAAPGADQTIVLLEQRVRELERANASMTTLVRTLSSRAAAPAATRVDVNVADLAEQVRVLTERQNDLSKTMLTMGMETMDLRNRQAGLQKRNDMLVSYTLGQSAGR